MAKKTANQANLISRMTGRVVGAIARRPRLFMWPILILACAAAGVTVSELRLQTGSDALVDPAAEFSQSWTQYTEEFSSHGDLIVVVETSGANSPVIREALDSIAARLRQEPEYFRNVLSHIDKRKLRPKSLQLLSTAELQEAGKGLKQYSDAVRRQDWGQLRIASMSVELRREFANYRSRGISEKALIAKADNLAWSLDRFVEGTRQNDRYNAATFPSPWERILPASLDNASEDRDLAYFMAKAGNQGWLKAVVVPNDTDLDPNAASISRLREICQEVEESYADTPANLRVLVTGTPVLEHDELARAGHDMLFASLLAAFLVGALLSFGFRSVRHPMLILLTLVVALACTFGVATLAIGHLNILSLCFTAILIGLGVDFGVHFLSRYLHIRQTTNAIDESLQQAGLESGSGIITSAMTTAMAFGSAALTGFPGLAELGVIAGSGILISAACTFLFLPALIAVSDAGTRADKLPQPMAGRLFRRIIAGVPLIVIAVSVLAVVGIGSRSLDWTSGEPRLNVAYDSNLMELQDPKLDSVQAQRRLWDRSGESLLYAVAVAESQKQAAQFARALSRLPTVSHVTELATSLPGKLSAAKQRAIGSLRSQVSGTARSVPVFPRVSANGVARELDKLHKTLAASADPDAEIPAARLDRCLDQFVDMSNDERAAYLGAYQNLLASSLIHQFGKINRSSSLEPINSRDLPRDWATRLIQRTDDGNRWLVKIYPKNDIWDDAELAAFVQEIRGVSPSITGVPVQNYEAARQLQASWITIAVYSLAAISLFLLFEFLRPGQKVLTLVTPLLITGFIGYTMHNRSGEADPQLLVGIYLAMVVFIALVVDFRNLRDTVIALVPAIGGAALMAGVMAMFHIELNPLNLIVLPLILGIGVDDGIHIVHDYRRQIAGGSGEYSPSGEILSGVILTSLTTIVGFGSLVIAGHQGLVSVGIVMSIGVTACLLVALIPLPALLTLVARHQPPLMEPLAKAKPKVKKAATPSVAHSDDEEEDDDDEATRPMTRREKRRMSRAA